MVFSFIVFMCFFLFYSPMSSEAHFVLHSLENVVTEGYAISWGILGTQHLCNLSSTVPCWEIATKNKTMMKSEDMIHLIQFKGVNHCSWRRGWIKLNDQSFTVDTYSNKTVGRTSPGEMCDGNHQVNNLLWVLHDCRPHPGWFCYSLKPQ